jgi:hypothetical protein
MDDLRENSSTNNIQNEVKKGEELPAEPSDPSAPSAMDVGCSTDNEICNCKPTATTTSTLTTDASEEQEQGGLHLDFKCFYCSQVCSSNNDRVLHIENEHQGKLYYPTPEDFENRLSR